MDDDVTTVKMGVRKYIPEIIRRITEKCQGIKEYDTASFRHTIIIDFDLLLLFKFKNALAFLLRGARHAIA